MKRFRALGWKILVDIKVSHDGLWGMTSVDEGVRCEDLVSFRIVSYPDVTAKILQMTIAYLTVAASAVREARS